MIKMYSSKYRYLFVFKYLNRRTFSLSDKLQQQTCCHHFRIMENIIFSLAYFALQRNVYLKFLGVLSKRAIELQNAIIIARLGGALAH